MGKNVDAARAGAKPLSAPVLLLWAAGCAHFDPVAGAPFVGTYVAHQSFDEHSGSGTNERLELRADGTYVDRYEHVRPWGRGRDEDVYDGRWWPEGVGIVLRPRGDRAYRAWLVERHDHVYMVDEDTRAKLCSGLIDYEPLWEPLVGVYATTVAAAIQAAEFCARTDQQTRERGR